jgi:hypothetical protein
MTRQAGIRTGHCRIVRLPIHRSASELRATRTLAPARTARNRAASPSTRPRTFTGL